MKKFNLIQSGYFVVDAELDREVWYILSEIYVSQQHQIVESQHVTTSGVYINQIVYQYLLPWREIHIIFPHTWIHGVVHLDIVSRFHQLEINPHLIHKIDITEVPSSWIDQRI
tara:strand:+ start:310 stop:648 length:339 start_codon:yes stop_codon:yes gene_type:complete